MIREPDTKNDLTKGGFQMFDRVNTDLAVKTSLFDKVLFLNSYLETADLLKWDFLNSHFPNFTLKKTGDNWNFLDNSNRIVYSIVPDSHLISSIGSEWIVYGENGGFFHVKCIDKNAWSLLDDKRDSLTQNNLLLTCTNSKVPSSYQHANFQITGSEQFYDRNFSGAVLFLYSIVEPLLHDSTSTVFYQGKLNISVSDLVLKKQAETEATYLISDSPSVEIIFNGMTNLYKNINSYDYIYQN
jgi:hypothetical protein